MVLPTFRSLGARRRERNEATMGETANGVANTPANVDGVIGSDLNSERTLTPTYTPAVNIKEATKTRKVWVIISSFLFVICVIFLILTIIGNINGKAVIRNTYFYRLDLTNIIPATADDIIFVNSLARSLGLHDFYQVGLWNFCEGYNNEGITSCSSPQALYWFNPVEVLLNELLSGATIALPAEINNILTLIRIASHVMFGFFLTGVCMNFVSIFIVFVAIYSRWWSFGLTIWTFTAALLTTAASIIGTVMAVVFRNVATSQTDLNIGASIGTDMFAFMWIGAGSSIIGFLIHFCLMCCCASRRDIKTGRRKGRQSAYGDAVTDEKKKPARRKFTLPKFPKKKRAAEVV